MSSAISKRSATVKVWIEAKPGAQGRPFTPRKGSPPLVVIYKVMGKLFGILPVRGIQGVILKCDPQLASHATADRKNWIVGTTP